MRSREAEKYMLGKREVLSTPIAVRIYNVFVFT
jgi:hypothetical protein